MENRTLTKYFKDLKLMEAYLGYLSFFDMDIPYRSYISLEYVCNKVGLYSAKEVYDFLVENDDPLFCTIYQLFTRDVIELRNDKSKLLTVPVRKDGEYLFPFILDSKIPEGIKMACGPIGTQTSRYHHESLQEHVALVAANLVDVGVEKELAKMLAVLHDVGKKYTSATNKRGEICFYNHAEVSAFIVSNWLHRWNISERMRKKIVAVVYGHMLPLVEWNKTVDWRTKQPVNNRQKWYDDHLLNLCDDDRTFADEIMDLIDTFSKCDQGVLEFTPEIREKIERGRALICE